LEAAVFVAEAVAGENETISVQLAKGRRQAEQRKTLVVLAGGNDEIVETVWEKMRPGYSAERD